MAAFQQAHGMPPLTPVDRPAVTVRPTASRLVYEFGPFRLDASARELTRDGDVIPLTAKVFDTLLLLVTNRARLVTKEELIAVVWYGSSVTDDSLVQNMSTLRRIFDDDVSQPRYIVTFPRRGYQFVAPTVAITDSPGREVAAATRGRRWVALMAAFAVGVMCTAGALIWLRAQKTPAPAAGARFQEYLPPNEALRGAVVVSPDGRTLAFPAEGTDGVTRLWVRPLDAPAAHAVPGTEGANGAFWSPDGRFIGFATAGEIKRVGLATGSIRVMAPTHRLSPLGMSWGTGDAVLYGDLGGIFSVPASGGTPTLVADAGALGDLGELRWPQMLPDGRHFLFFASGATPERGGTFLAALGSSRQIQLVPGYRATFAAPDHLIYVRDRTLIAQRIDVSHGRLYGAPMTIPGELAASTDISASSNGNTLVITAGGANRRLVWLDRQGAPLGAVRAPRSLVDVALSPDGRQALAATLEAGSFDLWLVDLERNVSTRVAADGAFPAWAPDGSRFAYALVGPNGADLYVQSTSGAAQHTAWLKTKELKAVNSWSADGRFVVFSKYMTREQTSQDLWLLPTDGDHREPIPYLQTKARERDGNTSPDGRWIAFTSDETGANEIYVQSFPAGGFKVRVSTGGGTQPLWRRDGRELLYVSPDRRVVSVSLSPGAEFKPGPPQPLFALPNVPVWSRQVDVSADGQRFLAIDGDRARDDSHVTVFTNWLAARRP